MKWGLWEGPLPRQRLEAAFVIYTLAAAAGRGRGRQLIHSSKAKRTFSLFLSLSLLGLSWSLQLQPWEMDIVTLHGRTLVHA